MADVTNEPFWKDPEYERGLQEALACAGYVTSGEKSRTLGLSAVKPDEPQAVEQLLVPQRCSPDGHHFQRSLGRPSCSNSCFR